MKSGLKLIGYTIISNIINTSIAFMITLILPKFLSVSEYGYFQLFLFYVGYIGFLPFGWLDGMYLRYGGAAYEELDNAKFSGQIKALCIIESIFGTIIVLFATFNIPNIKTQHVWQAIGIAIILTMPKAYLQIVFQITNRIRTYAYSVIIEKVVYGVAVMLFIIFNVQYYTAPIIAYIFGLTISLAYLFWRSKNIWMSKAEPLAKICNEIWENIRAGISLMFANIASMLIIGFVRLSIEKQWDVTTFGKVSLTMSVSNLLMIFIRAVALVMFPMLRRTKSDKLSGIYSTMRTCLMIPLLGMLIFYYPAKVILSAWLPQYADSLIYMAMLFPMCVFESKMSMLIETYMKTLRKEKWLLLVNVITVTLSVITTGITAFWLHNLDLAVGSIVFLLAFRCVFAELLLSTVLEVNVKKDICLELALTVIFIGASWFIGGLAGLAVYAAAYLVYVFIKRKDVVRIFGIARKVFKKA